MARRLSIAVPADVREAIPLDLADVAATALIAIASGVESSEPVPGAADNRVRTVSLAEGVRLGLFVVENEEHTVLIPITAGGADEVIQSAGRSTLRVHPGSGVPRVDTEDRARGPLVDHPYTDEVPSRPALWGGSRPVTRAELVNDFGIDASLAEQVVRAADADEVFDLADLTPQRSQAETLRMLVTPGHEPETVRTDLGLTRVSIADVETDAALVDAFERNASRMNYALLDGEHPDDLGWMLRRTRVDDWRAFLHPMQRELVVADYRGSARVTGGAGTGKTVVLLHRAARLARQHPSDRIVLTTFTKALASRLSRDLTALAPDVPQAKRLGEAGVFIVNIDALARRTWEPAAGTPAAADAIASVLGTTGNEARRPEPEERARWTTAIGMAGDGVDHNLANIDFLRAEYACVILANSITHRVQYERVRRSGRVLPLNKAQRRLVWKIVEAYRWHGATRGVLDFAEVAALAGHLHFAGSLPKLADHVLVDEAQDLTPCHWKLVRGLVSSGPNDIFIAEDVHQRIYPRTARPAAYNIKFTGVGKLQLSYRVTSQVLAWGMNVLDGTTLIDLDDTPETHAYRAVRSGPNPRFLTCHSPAGESDAVVGCVKGWIGDGVHAEEIAVLGRSNQDVQRLKTALTDEDIPVAGEIGAAGANGVQVGTLHKAKGLEFACVAVTGQSAANHQAVDPSRATPEMAERLQRDRALVYMAGTRARDELVVTFTGTPSPLLRATTWQTGDSASIAAVPPVASRAWVHVP